MKIKISKQDILSTIVLFIYMLELVFPKINTLFPITIVCIICFGVWLLMSYIAHPKFFWKSQNIMIILIYLYFSIYPLIFGYSSISHRYTECCLIICGTIIFSYYQKYNKLDKLENIVKIIMIFTIITMIITFQALLRFPYISRSIKSSGEYSYLLSNMGIGGYSFIYFIAALSILILYVAMESNNKRKKAFFYIFYISCFVFIVKANYMTALLVIIIPSLILLLLKNNKKNIVSHFFYYIGIISLILFITMNYEKIINSLLPYIPSRISGILSLNTENNLFNSILDEFIYDRWPVIEQSLISFFENPILGLIGSRNLGYDGEFLTGFGQHSYIIDTFSLYGVIGGGLNIYIILRPFKYFSKKMNSLDIAVLTALLIIYLLNNATESIALVFTIIYPMVRCNFITKEREGIQT